MVEKTAPFKNIRRKDQPLKQSPVPIGSTSRMITTAGIKATETSANNLTGDELPQWGRRDHNLVKGLLIQPLYIQVLGNGIKASIHGSQCNHTGNQKVQIGLSM